MDCIFRDTFDKEESHLFNVGVVAEAERPFLHGFTIEGNSRRKVKLTGLSVEMKGQV